MKDKLVFDTTDANTIADSDSVGAFLRASDGTLLTHTDVGGKKALDVRIAEGINVEVDLSAGDDSVAAWLSDGSGNAISSTAGSLNVNLTNTEIAVTQGSDSPWSIDDGGGSITVDGSVTVSATDLDIRDLTHVSDSVRLGDGTNFYTSTTVGADLGLDVYALNDPATANTAIATAAETLDVASTSQDIIVSPLANRKVVYIYNNDNRQMEIGPAGFAVGSGFPISPSSYMELRAGSAVDIEFNSPKLNHAIRTMELS